MLVPLAVISGATGGIGRVVTERLWLEGYSLLAIGKTPEKCLELDDWLLTHPRYGQTHDVIQMDVTKAQQFTLLRRSLNMYGSQVQVLAICHGASPQVRPALDTYAMYGLETIWQTDIVGTFRLCQDVGRVMVEHKYGSIVFVSSLHAKTTYPQRLAYSVAKSALSGMVRSLALEWGPLGVRINAVLPWQVAGPRTQTFLGEAKAQGYDLLEAYLQRCPSRRLVNPSEVADAIMFLARNEAMNGTELVLDGGVSQSMWYKPFFGS